MKNKNIVVTGGAGYCGSKLVPQLLDMGYFATVFDTFWFGQEFLPTDNPGLKLVEGDIRDTNLLKRVFTNHSTVINLACISNDASFELDESLSTSVNLEAFEPMVIAAKKSGTLPKVVIPVHFSGQSCDMKMIHKLALEYGFKVIEDAILTIFMVRIRDYDLQYLHPKEVCM